MFESQTVKGPVQIRAEQRRAEWEAERLEELRKQVKDGLITEEEAKERGL